MKQQSCSPRRGGTDPANDRVHHHDSRRSRDLKAEACSGSLLCGGASSPLTLGARPALVARLIPEDDESTWLGVIAGAVLCFPSIALSWAEGRAAARPTEADSTGESRLLGERQAALLVSPRARNEACAARRACALRAGAGGRDTGGAEPEPGIAAARTPAFTPTLVGRRR